MKKGKLIIFEGIDGSGKSTQAKLLYQKLMRYHVLDDRLIEGSKVLKFKKNVVLTKEPNNKTLRNLILKSDNHGIDLFLFLADRGLHYQKIEKWLSEGKIIICDRSFPSTWAYQYYAGELKKCIDEKTFLTLDNLSRNFIKPDLIIIVDISPQLALKRLKARGKIIVKKFEKLKYLEKVRSGYKHYAKRFNWMIIDGCKEIEKISQKMLKMTKKLV
jgi:dTMP kinase